MKRYLLILALIISPALAADVYKRQADDGTVEYSDRPQQGGEKIDLPPTNQIDPPKQTNGLQYTPRQGAKKEDRYDSVRIVSPADQSVIRDNSGRLLLILEIKPKFHAEYEHQIVVLVDGQEWARFEAADAIQIQGIERGSHSIIVRIIDRGGARMHESPAITLHFKRFSILHPKPVQ